MAKKLQTNTGGQGSMNYLLQRRNLKNKAPHGKKEKEDAQDQARKEKVKNQKPIAHRSKKLAKVMKEEYIPLVEAFLAKPENQQCQVNSEVCTHKATVIHHAAGRTGKALTNEKDWIPSCGPCNIWIEGNDAKARQMGVKKSRITKPNR